MTTDVLVTIGALCGAGRSAGSMRTRCPSCWSGRSAGDFAAVGIGGAACCARPADKARQIAPVAARIGTRIRLLLAMALAPAVMRGPDGVDEPRGPSRDQANANGRALAPMPIVIRNSQPSKGALPARSVA